MDPFQKITRTSKVLEQICLLFLLALPFYLAHHWLLPQEAWIDGMPFDTGRIAAGSWPPPAHKQVAGILVSFIPGAFIAAALWRLRQLFKLYARGEFFSANTVALYSRIAASALWFIATLIAAQSTLSVLMSYDTESRYISLTFTHAHAFILFGAILLRLVTWIMAVGHELENENKSFV